MEPTIAILVAGAFMAWSVGANDSAKAVGTAVGSNILSFKQAVLLIILFSILGAYFGGSGVAQTVGKGIVPALDTSLIPFALLSAGFSVTVASLRGIPISTTQAIIGAIIGIGVYQDAPINWGVVGRTALAWIVSPLAAALFSILFFKAYEGIINRMHSIKEIEILYIWMAFLSASYASFNLGANELSNVIGLVEYGTHFGVSLKLWMAVSLALGALTFSYEVIMTIGKRLTVLGPMAAFSSQFGSSLAVTIANVFGLPVSSGQAIIGGVIGVGMLKGQKINQKLIADIVKGWVLAPVISFSMTLVLIKAFHAFLS
ncbi:hypothetical protein PAP_07815 [Palaeococcus pacificus DY20341]|uniref:Sodium:phosphate symporter n=2 Tax=Palaeococcus TaxID=83867 RepID=A0A075LVB9_9EURY|nr:hypothetical protein PAP_07815 [Palaeococcus pacificus DY20341]